MSLQSEARSQEPGVESQGSGIKRRPALVLVTLIPLIWLLAVTMTAGVQKIFHPDDRIGFLAQAQTLNQKLPSLEQAVSAAKTTGNAASIGTAEKALHTNRVLHFNNVLDAAVAGTFLVLVAAIVLLSAREWILLLARRKLAVLRESEPVWLPDYAIAEARPLHLVSLIALAFALVKELSGEAQMEREQQMAAHCACAKVGQASRLPPHQMAQKPMTAVTAQQSYLAMTERRFNGVTRCC